MLARVEIVLAATATLAHTFHNKRPTKIHLYSQMYNGQSYLITENLQVGHYLLKEYFTFTLTMTICM